MHYHGQFLTFWQLLADFLICGYWTREPVPSTILRVPCASDSERYFSAIALSVRSDTHREYQLARENELKIQLYARDLLLGKRCGNTYVLGLVAIGAYRAIAEKGLRIPEDISIVGFNDQPNARYMMPPLTTVRVETKYIGYAAVDLLVGMEHRKKEYNEFLMLPTELKIRRSCAPLASE